MEKLLRTHIKQELSSLERKLAPKVYKAISTTNGYKNIEEKIIRMVCKEGLSISACIPNIERQL